MGEKANLCNFEHFLGMGGVIVCFSMTISVRALGLVRTLLAILLLGVMQLAAEPLDPVATSPTLSADEVANRMVERNRERARALESYQGTRVYRLDYRGFWGNRSAEVVVDMKYRSPATKEFSIRSEKGSKIIIDRIFKRMLQTEKDALSEEKQRGVALNQENYRFTLAGYESGPSGANYILLVEPRSENKLLYRGRIWVDAEDFAVVRIEASPAVNPSFWTRETKVDQRYSKVGIFWLPLSNRSSSEIRLGGHASFSIDYQDYQITAAGPVRKENDVAGNR